MMNHPRNRRANPLPAAAAWGLLFALGCITVNINFPARQVERAAEVIVDEARPEADTGSARSGSTTPPGEKPSGSEGSSSPLPSSSREEQGSRGDQAPRSDQGRRDEARSRFLPVSFAASPLSAQEEKKKEEKKDSDIRINIDTPLIREIRQNLQKRFPKLLPFYEKGALGENREGYVEARDQAKLSLAEKRDLKTLLEEENRDRRNLYQEIVRANKFDQDRLKDVQRIFAAQWREKSRTGWWIQTPEGEWVRKPPPPEKDKKPGSKEKKAAGAV